MRNGRRCRRAWPDISSAPTWRIYHLRSLRPEDRAARRDRYKALDPGAVWQPGIGYDYLADESGFAPAPRQRPPRLPGDPDVAAVIDVVEPAARPGAMNVLVIGNYFDRDGLTSKVLSEGRHLAPLGVRLVIVVPWNPFARGGAAAKLRALGYTFHCALTHFRVIYFFFPFTVVRLNRIMRREKIDLLHVNHGKTLLLGAILSRLRRVPLVYTIHGVSRRELPRAGRNLLFRRVFCVLPVSEESAAFFAGRVRFPAERVVVLRNAIDFSHFAPAAESRGAGLDLLYLSRLDADKRVAVEAAMDAMALIAADRPQARLRILGDGRQCAAVMKKARAINGRLGREAIVVEGWADDPAPYMAKAVAVLGVGRCVLEAIAAGRPVVVVGNEEIGGLVTEANFFTLQRANFSGRGSGVATCGANLARELRRLSAETAGSATLRALARTDHDAVRIAPVIREIFQQAILSLSRQRSAAPALTPRTPGGGERDADADQFPQ